MFRISLGVGEPDFVTPWHIREAAIYALERGRTSYTSNLGLPKLREVICRYVEDNLMKAIYLRFGLPALLPKQIELNIHHDEEAQVYVNGTKILHRRGHVTHYQRQLLKSN